MLWPMSIEELAAAVRERRLARGWSVEEAARRAGINRVTYKRIESGLPVQDVKRRAVEEALGIDDAPRPEVNRSDAGDVARLAAAELNPDLAEFTDQELLDEIAARFMLIAGRLRENSGPDLLAVTIGKDGARHIVTHTTKRIGG